MKKFKVSIPCTLEVTINTRNRQAAKAWARRLEGGELEGSDNWYPELASGIVHLGKVDATDVEEVENE